MAGDSRDTSSSSFPSLEDEDLRKFFPEKLDLGVVQAAAERGKGEGEGEAEGGWCSRFGLGSLISKSKKIQRGKKKKKKEEEEGERGSERQYASSTDSVGAAMSQVVVAAFDATKKLTFEAVDWALLHILQPGDSLVILGIITKIKSPLGVDILASLDGFRGVNQRVLDYEISQRLMDYQRKLEARRLYCLKKGFKLEVTITAGYPLKQVLVREAEQTQATWVIMDAHLRGYKKHLMRSLQCSLVLMDKQHPESGHFLRIQSGYSYDSKAREVDSLDASYSSSFCSSSEHGNSASWMGL